jgi:signal transduction histidine kinase
MKDSFHQVLLEEYCDNRIARDTWEKARSYANVPIKDGDNNLIGTISLISGHSWLFTRPRVRAMVALSQRASYLIEHFKTQKERQFLLDISSDFVRNADFTQPVRTINETVKRFRAAANADIAALFIWDKEAERFVLRAQDGFADEKWVDADRYKRGERWTGSVALADAPQYVADMFAHKMKHHLASAREYETHAFGEPLSAHFTVEAIGLPLRLKRDQTIGVLTLYRRIDPQQPAQVSGFTTINARILQEAADTLSAELSALLYFLRMEWMKKEMKRHEAVRQALEKGDRHVPIEQRLCNQMVKSFHADRAILYLPLNEERQANLYPSADAARENMTPPTTNVPDEMVVQAVRERKIQEKKKNELSIKELQNPETAKTEGLVERIALPLLNEDRLVGVLDLNIRRTRKQSHLVAMHDPEQLEELARKVALVYQQQKELERKAEAEAQAERGRLAVQAMGAMVFQTAHRLLNLTQSIRSLSILIESAKSDHERSQKLSELFKLINSATDGIKRPMEIARQMKDIKPRPYDLHFLVNEALLESDIRQHLSSPDIRALIPEKLMVLVDHDLIREAFRNTIHNAMKAMPNGGSLTINATLSDDSRIAQVVFADTGVGMSEAQKRAALSGFVTTQGGTGLGVLVSLLLIRAQNGDLKIDSKPGEGTKVVVTLPATQREERV